MEQAKRMLALVLALVLLLPPVRMPAAASETEAAEQEAAVEEVTEIETTEPETAPAEQESAKPEKKVIAVKSIDTATATAIEPDQTLTAEVPEGGYAWFSFTPTEDGFYIFTSESDVDTYAELYDKDQNFLTSDDDGGEGNNYSLAFSAVAGEVYYLAAGMYGGGAGTYAVKLSASEVASISVDPLTLIEGTCGNMVTGSDTASGIYNLQYYHYNWWNYMTYTVTMKNGDTVSGEGASFEYDGQWYGVNWYDEQDAGNVWTPGGPYTSTISLMGATAQVNVTITESPVASVSVNPISMIENYGGYWQGYYNPDTGDNDLQYYHYLWRERLSYTITLTDGSTISCSGTGFEYDGQWYSVNYTEYQSEENQWTVGNTYTPTIYVMGVSAPVSVSIMETPVASIAAEPISLAAGTNGDWRVYQSEDMEVEYYHYYWWNQLSYTVTLTDGSTVSGEGARFYYDGQEYGISTSDDQSGANIWTGGNVYTPTVTLMGVTAEVSVTIEESPIASITAAPITLVEGMNGSWYTHHHDGTEIQYFKYEWQYQLSYTVTLTDGSTLSGSGTHFYYDGQGYDISWSDEQSGLTPWAAGNTYTPTITLMGTSAQVSVTITQSPVQSIAIAPVTMIENAGGYLSTGNYNPETGNYDLQYYQYHWWNYLTYTVTMKNGDTVDSNGTGFSYNGQWFGLATNDQQSADAPWTAGNTYTVNVSLTGLSVPVSVTIEASPVASITAEPITVCEGMDGNWSYSYSPDTGVETQYYRYEWAHKLSYTVTMTDGSTVSGSSTGFSYNGQYYNINYSDDQSASNPWTVGNTYTPTISLMGATAQVSVTVDSSPVASITVTPIEIMENSNGYWAEDYNPETGAYESYYRYHWYGSLQYTVVMKDGSTISGWGTSIYYNGQWYYTNNMDDQSAGNPWQAGNTYYPTITLMGMTAQVPVTIEECPIVSLAVDPITLTYGVDGSWENAYNSETGNYDRMYYRLYWRGDVSYTATMADGSVIRGTNGDGIQIGDTWYGLNTNDDQSADSPWAAGNTYTGTVSIMGVSAPVDITVTESPVESVSFDAVEIPEGAGGYWSTSYDSESQISRPQYFEYYWWQKLSYTVTFRDGTTVQGTGTGFDYNGQWFSVGYSNGQNVNNQWTAGNTYTQTVGLAGVQAQVPVTIAANEIASVAFKTVNMVENHSGEWCEGTNSETGETQQYYKYNWREFAEYTVTMADGGTVQGTGTSFNYNGENYQLFYLDDQSASKQMLVGNTYAFDVKLGSMELEVLVTVSSAMEENGYVYSVLDGAAVIADCTLQDTVLTIPETLGEYPVTGVLTLGQALDYAEEIVVPDSVTMAGHNAFTGFLKPLKKLTLGSGISDIRLSQHYYSWYLEHIEVSENNPLYTSVDGVVYDKDVTTMIMYPANKEDTHIIPDSVTDIDILFHNDEYGDDSGLPPIYEGVSIRTGAGLTDYTTVDGIVYSADMTKIYTCEREASGTYVMPDSVTDVYRYAFANSSLEDVTWSKNVTEIVYGAFCYNDDLKTIRVPSTVKAIGLDAFGNSRGLESVYIEDLAAWCEIGFIDNPLYFAGDLYLNEELVTDLQIPEGVEEIPYFAFAGVSATSLTLPGTVHTVDYYAFKGASIQTAVLSEGLKTIEERAFYGSKLQSVTLPDSLTQMGWEAFADCTELESVHIGAGLTQIQGNTFSNAGLKSVVIPANIQSIGWAAFEYNPLQEVVFENENVEISDYAFLGCPLKEVNLPAAITQIADSAFARNEAVTISFPDSVTEIMYGSFAFSENLISVVLPENIQTINASAFKDSTRLSHVLYKGSAEQWSALGVDSEELSNAALHTQVRGNEVAVVETCTRMWHYCYVCSQWEYIEKTDDTHTIENGVCTVCGYTEGAEETEPEVPETEYIPTEPEATEPEVTEPEATDPEATQPPLGTPEAILEAAYALASGESLDGTFTLTGTISAVNTAYSSTYSNITVTMQVEYLEDMPIRCYRLKGDGADQIGIGDTITVTGTITNYNGTVQFAAGCTLDSWENTGTDDVVLTTPEEIVKAAYALEVGASLTKEYTLTGVITAVNSAYNSTYGNVTVTMQVGDMADMPIQCFRLKGDGADLIGVGDTITVTGSLKNYNGTIEFDNGCTLDSYELAEPEATEPEVTEPEATEPEGDTLSIAEAVAFGLTKDHNTYSTNKYNVTGVITEVYNTTYGNMYITDGNGNTLTLYGTYDATGTNRYDAMAVQPVAGDTITIYGSIGQYNGVAQIKNGWIVDHIPAEPEVTEPEVTEPTEPEVTEPVVTEPVSEQIFDLTGLEAGTAYEEDTRDLGNGVTVTVVDGLIKGGIRLNNTTAHHAKATFTSEKPIHGIHFHAGSKTGTVKVEGYKNSVVYQTRSTETTVDDSENWVVIAEVPITSTEYTDYAVDFGDDSYSDVRLSFTGDTYLWVRSVTMEYEAEEPEATEPEATEPESTEPEVTEPEATEPEVTEPEPTEPEATEPTEPTEPSEPESSEPEATEPETVDPATCEHSYGDWVITKAPTFTASGRQQKTCSICGKVVTQAIMPAVATVEKWNISLVDDLMVNFHLLVSSSIESTAKVKISLADDTITYNVKDLPMTDEGLYVVSVELAAAQMADDIVVFIVDKNQIGCYANYTVRQYADTVLADESLSDYHALVREMLNYGAAAQSYFGYSVDSLANEGITGAGAVEIPEAAGEAIQITGAAEGVSFYAASLFYREKIAVRLYFKFSGDINAYTFTANGETLTPGLKDGFYYVDVTGITPERLDQQVEVTVTDGSGNALVIGYSPMNYIVRMNQKGSESLKALLKALYNYHLAAKAFYGKDDSGFKALDSGVWKSQSVVDGRLYDVTIDFRTQNNSVPHCGIGYGDDVTDNLQYWLDGGVALIEIDGRYYYCGSGDGGNITYTTNGNTVSVDCESYIWITLERIAADQLMVTSSEGSPLPVGVLLTWSEQ